MLALYSDDIVIIVVNQCIGNINLLKAGMDVSVAKWAIVIGP
jgi:hypothetical protein